MIGAFCVFGNEEGCGISMEIAKEHAETEYENIVLYRIVYAFSPSLLSTQQM